MQQMTKHNIIGLIFIILLTSMLLVALNKQPPKERTILLSFDTEPVDERCVLEIVKILDEEKINATFFVTGQYAEEYPDVIQELKRFEIGCHTYSHKKLTKIDEKTKREEISRCTRIIKKETGQKVKGFRAPWHRIDKESLKILEEEGYQYDASIISGLGLFYPSVKNMKIGEIPVSSVMGIPVEDVIWTYYLKMPTLYFSILRNKEGKTESYVFHPHHIVKEKERFQQFIKDLKKRNVTFISHAELIRKHGG